jgi:hypothetical protein
MRPAGRAPRALVQALLAVLVLVLCSAAAVAVARVRKVFRKESRWAAAASSAAPCGWAPPALGCPQSERPPGAPPAVWVAGGFQTEVADFFLAAASAMVGAVLKKGPTPTFPGVAPAQVAVMGSAAHPLLACSFVSGGTRFVVFRGTSSLSDLYAIDMSLGPAGGAPAATLGGVFWALAGSLVGRPGARPAFPQTEALFGATRARVHAGFWGAYVGLVRPPLVALLARDPPEVVRVCVGGHSMGGSLSQLCAADLATAGEAPRRPVALYACASTRVGDAAFARLVGGAPGLRAFNVKNTEDPVPDSIPPVLPDFSSPADGAMLEYVTSGEVVSITAHAPTLELCHFTPTYRAGLAARAARVAQAAPPGPQN